MKIASVLFRKAVGKIAHLLTSIPALNVKMKRPSTFRAQMYILTLSCVLGITLIPLQLSTVHADPISKISYVLCGTEAQFPFLNNDAASNQWAFVSAGSTATRPDGTTVTAIGYAGPAHNQNTPEGSCNGDYHYGWDQYNHKAVWKWANVNLHDGNCQVSAYIPSWYAGAPDAQYFLAIDDGSATPTTYTATLDQGPYVGWTSLNFANNGIVPLPKAMNTSTYSFVMTLQNGGSQGWYLAADAIKFDCNVS